MTNRDCKFTLLIYLYDVPPTIFCYLTFIRASSTLASLCATTTGLHIVLEAAQVESKNLPQTPTFRQRKASNIMDGSMHPAGLQCHSATYLEPPQCPLPLKLKPWCIIQYIWWYLFWLYLSRFVCFNYSLVCCVFKKKQTNILMFTFLSSTKENLVRSIYGQLCDHFWCVC